MGPSLLFDKSFLQSLSVDEATMLDQLYQCIITPIFFVEMLADIAKEPDVRRPPEKVVRGLAERTPVCHSAVNADHWDLAVESLMGRRIPLDGRPAVPGGVPVQMDGRAGVVFQRSREAEAFERWQLGQFDTVEREFAGSWRTALSELRLEEVSRAFKGQLKKEQLPKNLEDARALASHLMSAGGMNYRALQLAITLVDAPTQAVPSIVHRWKLGGRQPLTRWAPFAAHCVEVDLFMYLAMSNGLISDQRASNLVDMAYLYYLPFARVFVSSDKLHKRVAPLFLTGKQAFVWGPDLKNDLTLTDAHFASLPDVEKAKGLFVLASYPPPEAKLITRHWDTSMPAWRESQRQRSGAARREKHNEAVRKIIDKITHASDAAIALAGAGRAGPSPPNPDHMIIQRHIPRQRGKWRMFSKEVEDAEDKRSSC